MARVTSPVEICNLALDMLKQAPINSIETPVTQSEYVMARWYDTVRQECLRSHPWKFAITRAVLTPDLSATPPFGYAYAYNLPSDYIRLISIGDDYIDNIKRLYEVENYQLLLASSDDTTDGSTIYVRYLYDATEVTKFDPLFIMYLTLQLALNLVNKFSISTAIQQKLEAAYLDVETKARAVNGQDKGPKRIQRSKILTKRRGLPGGVFASKYTEFS